jgi:glycerol transport system ATP-binding protein
VLLDEPLANLDYKLREELRVEIPRIFEESGAIFVYATTEPEEALLLGGNTATLHQGRITQFGPTPHVYRAPRDAITAEVFSDPPMNFTAVRVSGGRAGIGAALWDAGNLPDGEYRAGFRPAHLSLHETPGALPLSAVLETTEITGAQTFLHLHHESDRWFGLVNGVHPRPHGQQLTVWLDPAHVYLFARDGTLARAAPYARAA